MSSQRPRHVGRAARLLWAGLGIVLLVFLGLSFVLSGSALEEAEVEAEERAERYAASVLFTFLTPELASGDILGSEYRDLLIRVQAGILSDDRVVQVRIWKPDGDLIFSTAQRDQIDEFVAADDPQIQQAAEGETVSVITEGSVSPRQGLQGSDEQLFQTFVPLQLADELSLTGVVQIDQRFAAIEDEAVSIWRTIQVALIVALGCVAVLFGISLRGAPATALAEGEAEEEQTRPERQVRRDERKLRDAEERAVAAERAAREVEARLADAERRLEAASEAEVPPDVAARVEELELKLRADSAEREQFAAEGQELRAELLRKEAALSQQEARAGELERQVAAAGETLVNAEKRLASAEERILASRGELESSDARLKVALAKAEGTGERGRSGKRPAGGDDAKRVAELEARVRELEGQRQREIGDLQRAHESLANTQVELVEATRRYKVAEERIGELERGRVVAAKAPADGAPAYAREGEAAAAPAEETADVGSFAARLAGLRELATHTGASEGEPASGGSEDEELAGEPLSLRERLARAAAARHRVSGSDD